MTAFDWNSYLSRSKVLLSLKDDQHGVDILLTTSDGSSFLVHGVVVSTLSPKFSQLLLHSINSSKPVEETNKFGVKVTVHRVFVPKVCGKVLNILIDCAYKGYLGLSLDDFNSEDDIWNVLMTAQYYEMSDVIQTCCSHLLYKLKPDNCVKYLHLGLKYKSRLRTAAWNMILRDFVEVMHSQDFGLLSPCELEGLLKHDELNISNEEIVWEAIKLWINSEGQPNNEFLNDTIQYNIGYSQHIEEETSFSRNQKQESKTDQFLSSQKLCIPTETLSRKSYLLHFLSFLRYLRISPSFLNQIALDPLIISCPHAQKYIQQIIKSSLTKNSSRHQNTSFPCGLTLPTRPRIPYSILFAIGGWEKGVPTNLIETYDVRVNKWFCSSSHFARAYHGAQCIDGLLYLIGGTNGEEILSSLQCCDLSTGKWYERANMFQQRCYVSSVVLNGHIIAMGGHNGITRMRSVERYDPLNNQWTIMEEMNLARSDASATVLNGKIYIAGGLNDQVIENSVEVWDGNRWSFIRPMNSPRTSLALVSYLGSLYALGGNNGFERLATVEKYSFKDNSWTHVAPMKSRRSTFSAGVLENKIYVVGGYNGHSPINEVESYSEETQEWSKVKNLKYDRSGLTVCVVSGLSNSKEFTFLRSNQKSLLNSPYSCSLVSRQNSRQTRR